MAQIWITALGVGGATVVGALIGFLAGDLKHKWSDAILGFAAGIMLAAAVLGLIVPSVEAVGKSGIWITVLGIVCGALFLNFADKVTPHLHSLTGVDQEEHKHNRSLDKVLLFVMAVAIHNLPEGMAAGVGFGGGNTADAVTVAVGIGLQNIPEGMVVIPPLVANGVSRRRALGIAALTGLVEVAGTLIGYLAASVSAALLPFLLAFAGGTMLYVISDEMIPETHMHDYDTLATWSLLCGFLVMLVVDVLLG